MSVLGDFVVTWVLCVMLCEGLLSLWVFVSVCVHVWYFVEVLVSVWVSVGVHECLRGS